MDNFEKAKNPVPVTSYNRHQLREKAMERIAQQGITAADVPDGKDSGWLLRELRVYQVELEMQNEQLMAAQLDMEASHRRYVTYYERAPVAYFTLNLQGVVIQCNEAAIQLLGYERFYLHGHGLLPLVYPEDQARFFAFYDELRMLAGPRNCQVRMRTKGGNLRYVHLEGSRGEADGTTEYLITATDLTGQQQNRDERAARAELLQSAEDIGQTGSYEVDLVTNTFRFSAGMFRLFGEPPHSFTPSQAFIDSRSEPDDAAAVRKIVAQAVAGKQPYGYTRRIRRSDGQWRTLESQGRVVCDAAGNAIRLLNVVRDVTELKKAGRETGQKAELLEATMNSSLNMIQVFEAVRNEHGEITDFRWIVNNRAAEKIYGDVIGKSLRGNTPGGTEEGIFGTFVQVVETGVPHVSERQYAHEQFSGWYEQSVVKLNDGVAITTADITARKEAEQAVSAGKAFLQSIIDSSLDVIQVFTAVRNPAGKIVDFTWKINNRKGIEQNGEVIGESLLARNPGVVPSGIFDRMVRVTETGVPHEHEQYYSSEQFHDQWFYQALVKQNDGVLMTTRDITGLKKAEQEVLQLKDALARQATEKYRELLNSIDQGFCIIGVKYDANDKPIDYQFQEVSPSFEHQTGIANGAGKWMRDIAADQDEFWFDTYGRIARDRKAERFEYFSTPLGRWWSVYAFPIAEPDLRRIGVLFNDITERKRNEQGQAYLLKLSDALRSLADPVAIEEAVTQQALHYFSADRCFFCQISEGHAIIRRDAFRGDLPSVAGTYPLSSFAIFNARVDAGQPLAVADVQTTDAVDERLRQLCMDFQVISFVDIPVIKQGKTVGMLCLVQGKPRNWETAEVALAVETAERTWAAVEKASVEQALRRSEEKYRTLFESMDEGVATMQLILNEAGEAVDFIYLDHNPAVIRQTGLSGDITGKRGSEVFPDQEPYWLETYGRVAKTGRAERHEFYFASLDSWFDIYISRVDGEGSHTVIAVYNNTTERKRTEEYLAESEEQFRRALEEAPIPVIMHAEDGEVLQISRTWTELTGFTLEEVPTLDHWLTHAYGEGADAVRDHMQHLFTGNQRTLNIDFPVRTRYNGLRHWSFSASSPGVLRDGRRFIVGMAVDITEGKRAQERLQRFTAKLEQTVRRRTRELLDSRDLLQSIFDTSLIGMAVLTAVRDESGRIQNFRIRLVNQELQRETGRTDLEGKLYADEYPGIREAGLFELMQQVVETGKPAGMEYYYVHEGFNKWFSSMFVRLDDGLVATNLDISERKIAEEAFLKNYQVLRQAEEVVRIGSWEYDIATATMHWSEGMYRLFGRPAGSPVNAETYLAYVIEEDRPAAQRLVHRLTNGHQPLEETLRMAVRGEVRTLKIKYVLLRTPEGHPGKILGVDVDISEIKRLEQENLEIRLEQQNQLLNAVLDAQEAEQHRIAEALHNGVGQILYAAKLNLEQVDLDTLPANRERMNRALETGSELLTEAIRETRRVSHELVPVLLRDFGLKAAISDFCTRLSEVIDLDYQVTGITERLAPYLEVALYRISQELVNNIIRHSAATEASLMLQKNGAAIQLDVTDNGKGFDPGQAGSPGLGLRSIADRVKLLNGTFQLQSRPGRGVRVHIIIPTEKIST